MSLPYGFGFVGTAAICELSFFLSLFHAMALHQRRQCDCVGHCRCHYFLSEFFTVFTARRYAIARYLLSSSRRIELVLGWRLFSTYRYCAIRKFGYLKNKGTSLWKFALDCKHRKFRHGKSIALSTKLVVVVVVDGQACCPYLHRSTRRACLLHVGQL